MVKQRNELAELERAWRLSGPSGNRRQMLKWSAVAAGALLSTRAGAVSAAPSSHLSAARAFAQEYKVNYPILLGEGREDVQDAYGPIWGIPASFLISKDGKVCRKHLGIAPKNVFDKEIAALLGTS